MKRITKSLRTQEGVCYSVFRYKNLKHNNPIIWDSIADAILLPAHRVATRKLRKACDDHRYYAFCIRALHSDVKRAFFTGTEKNALFDTEAKDLVNRYNRNKEFLASFLVKKTFSFNKNIYDIVMAVVICIIFLLPCILIIPIFDVRRVTTAMQKRADFKEMVATISNTSVRTIVGGVVKSTTESFVINNICHSFAYVTRHLSTIILASIDLGFVPIILITTLFIFVGIISIVCSCHRMYNNTKSLLQDAMEEDASIVESREFVANLKETEKQVHGGKTYFCIRDLR